MKRCLSNLTARPLLLRLREGLYKLSLETMSRKENTLMTRIVHIALFILLVPGMFMFSGCGGTNATSLPQASPTNSTPTTSGIGNPQSGDIPDTQAFVTYRSPSGGYSIEVPEGWARTVHVADVSFIDKLDGVQITMTQANAAPTVDSVRTTQVVALQNAGRGVRDVQVQNTQLPSGTAILITYTSDSDPNSVTGKQVRLENNQYLFFHTGKLATLTLWAPLGADNVDQWARISHSFIWGV